MGRKWDTANGNFWSGNYAYISLQWYHERQLHLQPTIPLCGRINGNGGTDSACGLLYANVNGTLTPTPSCPGNVQLSSNGTITSVAPVLSVSGNTVTIYEYECFYSKRLQSGTRLEYDVLVYHGWIYPCCRWRGSFCRQHRLLIGQVRHRRP